jgi:hypothetical protein
MRTSIALLTLAVANPAFAQTVPTTKLGRPDAAFPEPFSRVMGVRELPDGRLVISDNLEKNVALLDFASGDLTRIGREGQGPGEYISPGTLYAMPGDSALLVDLGNMRGLVIAPNGEVGRAVPFQRGEGLGALFVPRAVDGQGRIYGQPTISFRDGAPEQVDSMPIVRLDPTTDVLDSVAWMPSPRLSLQTGGGARSGGVSVRMGTEPYQATDAWAVAPDGRVALVRAREYRVEWLAPGGRRTVGPTLPYEPVKIGKAERDEWVNRPTQTATMRVGGQGARTIAMPRPNADEVTWPEAKPPFEGAVSIATTGEVWIRTSQRAGVTTALYDVVDARGQLVARIQLPEGRRLIGFGKGTLYTVNRDADDLEWLERYRLPGTRGQT